jgi:hypothetical protein
VERKKDTRAVRVTQEGLRVFEAALGGGFEELAAAA